MNLCINCIHYRAHEVESIKNDPNYSRCFAFGKTNPVDGSKIMMFCANAREFEAYCGNEGKEYVDAREVDLDLQHADMANQQRNADQDAEVL
jgi:hypothetical protein